MVRTRQKMWVQFAALLLGSERSEKWLYLLFYEIKTTTLNSFVTGKNGPGILYEILVSCIQDYLKLWRKAEGER